MFTCAIIGAERLLRVFKHHT